MSKIFVPMLVTTLLLTSCLQAQRPVPPSSDGPSGEAPVRLSFAKIAIPSTDRERIGMNDQSLLYADSVIPLIHLTDSGVSSLFNATEKSWGMTHYLEEQGQFQQAYNLLDRGWLGLAADSVRSVNLVSRSLASYALPFLPPAESVIGVGYDFVAFHHEKKLLVLEVKGGKAGLRELVPPATELKSVQKCIEGCEYWGFDGHNIQVLTPDRASWETWALALDVPEGVELLRVAGSVARDARGQPQVSRLYALGKGAELFAASFQDATRLPNWNNVSLIVRQSCLGCHGSDGFDQEAVWPV